MANSDAKTRHTLLNTPRNAAGSCYLSVLAHSFGQTLLCISQSEIALGFVLFDSSVGTEWMDEYDTDVNDHKFYQVRTKHYRVSSTALEAHLGMTLSD